MRTHITRLICLLGLSTLIASTPAIGQPLCPPNKSDAQLLELCYVSQETGFSPERIVRFFDEAKNQNISNHAATVGLRNFSLRLYNIKLQGREEVTFFAAHQALGFYRNLREAALAGNNDEALDRAIRAFPRLAEPQDRALLARFLFGASEFGRQPLR